MKMMNLERRLHPAAVLLRFSSTLKSLIIPILFTIFVGGTQGHPIFNFYNFIMAFLVISFVHSILYWLTFYYQVNDGEIKIKSGVLIKKVRYIRKERIQSIDLSAGIIERMFRLVKVRIETAGGGAEPEMHLIAIREHDAQQLREILLNKDNERGLEEDDDELKEKESNEVSWSMTYKQLLIAAITSSGLGLVLSAIGAFLPQIDTVIPQNYFFDSAYDYFLQSTIYHLVLGIFIILLIAWFISIAITVTTYGKFTVTLQKGDLKIVRGLLEKRDLTLNIKRITAIRIVSGIFRQPFGYCSVYVESGGGGTKEEQLSTILFPLIKKKDVRRVLGEFLPEYNRNLEFTNVPQKALIRYQLRILLVPILILSTLIVGFSLAYASLLILLIFVLFGYLQYKDAAIGFDEKFLVLRFRKMSQTIVLISKKNIQSSHMQTSVMQRWRKLVTIQVSILSSIMGKSFSIIDLSKSDGEKLLEWYSYQSKG
jgi:putative membrane protein